jgi:hypothetical protein
MKLFIAGEVKPLGESVNRKGLARCRFGLAQETVRLGEWETLRCGDFRCPEMISDLRSQMDALRAGRGRPVACRGSSAIT